MTFELTFFAKRASSQPSEALASRRGGIQSILKKHYVIKLFLTLKNKVVYICEVAIITTAWIPPLHFATRNLAGMTVY